MTSDRTDSALRLGVAGLGRGFVLMLPTFRRDERVRLVACAAPRQESRDAFVAAFGGRAHDSVEALCADPEVEAVYIATPHQMHRAHAETALAAGKHLLVEKPLCIALEDGEALVRAAATAGRHLIVGPSHSFDEPVAQARALIAGGRYGRVRMIQALNYTDFLYRPRRPEELDSEQGGGVVYSQAVHQVDVVRLLAGGKATSVRAQTGQWDPARPCEGAYSALLSFQDGAFAALTYSGYAHYDSDELCGWIGELGQRKSPEAYGQARRALAALSGPEQEAALKSARTFGAAEAPEAAPEPEASPENEHFGFVVVSCERADLRLTPSGIWIYGDGEKDFLPTPRPAAPRRRVIDALFGAVRRDTAPIQDAAWGLASLEVCRAILDSAASGEEIALTRQVAVRD